MLSQNKIPCCTQFITFLYNNKGIHVFWLVKLSTALRVDAANTEELNKFAVILIKKISKNTSKAKVITSRKYINDKKRSHAA